MSKMYNQMEKNTKNNVADEIRELISKLESKMEEAQVLGLSVEISISKLLPKEPMSVVVYEKVTY
jgi:peptide deformylase